MKKIFLLILVSTVFSTTSALGQLKVANNGNVTIKPNTTATPLSPLSVGNTGEQNVTVTAYRTTNGYDITTKIAGQYSTNWNYAITGDTKPKSSFFNVGAWMGVNSSTPNSFGRAFGVLGYAANSTSGYNYGVFGTVGGSNNGAGIVGTTGGNIDVNVPGTYAGYFVGNVQVTGTVTAQNITRSDSRLKENVLPLSKKKIKSLNTVLSMNPVEYNLKQVHIESAGDTASVPQKLYDEKSQQFQKKHFGLIAQELKEIYPELVYEEQDGYLAIDYTGLIPVLIQSIKELKSEIDELRETQLINNNLASTNTITPTADGSAPPFLYQNAPNPFRDRTEIRYYVPENIKSAQISIYNIQGVLLKQINIDQRGEGVYAIYGNEFTPGMYLYSLIGDNRQVDVKRMIFMK